MNTALKVEKVSISYKNIKRFSIHQILKRKSQESVKDAHFDAVKEVSFEVAKGEIVGVIGKNGSGKSTLLRSVAGIFQPDSGTIETYGNRISLMAIGVGFKPDITGRENIITSGMLMGYKKEYILEKMPEIIDFSELGDFIDKPVRTYSSGMYSKLSFAITGIMDADILLIDEVLSVGDERFKKKSFDKMEELILDHNKTVLIVTHNMETVRQLCNRVVWLHDGEVRMLGPAEDIVIAYKQFMAK
ncbi:MAG: ABC transporter ATP-binding protein [Eubacterium sp.]|nr:ABC transporter ATP-binding protein [Eubacterium sp.]